MVNNFSPTLSRLCTFTLIFASLARIAMASDVNSFLVQKGVELTQTNSNVGVPDSNNGFILLASVGASVTNAVTGATLMPPAGSLVALTEQSGNQDFQYKKKYDSLKKLNAGAPNGNYSFVITTAHEGTKTASISIQGDGYPQTLHLLNFGAAQNIDAGGYFVFQWEYMLDGSTPDFVQLKIQDSNGKKVFETADSGADTLNGSYTSLLLLRNTLLPNQTYQGTLLARTKVFADTTSYPGAVGAANYYRRVSFSIKTAPTASVADIKIYSIFKTKLFEQSGASTIVPVSNNGYLFQAQVEASATNTMGAAALALPNGTSTNLNSSDNKRFEFEAKLDTLQQLDGAYPDGNYTFRITTKNQGFRSPTIPLKGDAYPATPQFKNVDAALAIDPKQDFVLEWQPFTGATSSDFIHLQIEDPTGTKVMETADFAKADVLSGLNISAKIHDGTLRPGTSYTAKLLFVRISAFDTAMYPGALGAAGFGSETHLRIQTSGTPPAPPSLTAVRPSGNQGFQLLVNGAAGLTYRIEASTGLPSWLTVGTVTLSSGQANFTDTVSPSSAYRFYRAVQF